MGSVTDINEFKPHLTVTTLDGNVHVMPVELIESVAQGKIKASQLEDMDEVIQLIFHEWWNEEKHDSLDQMQAITESEYQDKLIHVGFTNGANLKLLDGTGYGAMYSDTKQNCYIPVYMLKAHEHRIELTGGDATDIDVGTKELTIHEKLKMVMIDTKGRWKTDCKDYNIEPELTIPEKLAMVYEVVGDECGIMTCEGVINVYIGIDAYSCDSSYIVDRWDDIARNQYGYRCFTDFINALKEAVKN